jgi:hypothetical protein
MATNNALNNSTGTLTINTLGAGVAQTSSSGVVSSSNGTNGQVLIGGGSAPVWANLTAGTGISLVNAANSVTINSSGTPGSITWNVITASSATMVTQNGYIIQYTGGTCALTMPTTAAVGDFIYVVGDFNSGGTALWTITCNSGQTIFFGTSGTTTPPTGKMTGPSQTGVVLVCTVANTIWHVTPSPGSGTGITIT